MQSVHTGGDALEEWHVGSEVVVGDPVGAAVGHEHVHPETLCAGQTGPGHRHRHRHDERHPPRHRQVRLQTVTRVF